MKHKLKAIECKDGYVVYYTQPSFAYSKEHVRNIAEMHGVKVDEINWEGEERRAD